MNRIRALLVVTLLVAAGCGGSSAATPVATLGLLSSSAPSLGAPSTSASALPSVAASPSVSASVAATPAPTPSAVVTPSPVLTPAPTLAPTIAPSAPPSNSGIDDPTSEDALAASFLQSADLPADATGGEPQLQDPKLASAEFKDNNGLRQASATWSSKTFTSLFDIRFQFPTADDAATFLDADEAGLSESVSGLEAYDSTVSNADDVRAYRGKISLLGVSTENFNYLIRVGNIVAKVFIGGTADLTAEEAETIAAAAAARIGGAVQGTGPVPSAGPSETPSPSGSAAAFNDDELDLLAHVPEQIQGGCESTDTIYGSEIDSVRCITDGLPTIDYSSFLLPPDMADEFESDSTIGDSPTTAKGSCAKANFEDTYTIAGDEAGSIRCMIVTGTQTGTKYKVIEWTNEKLLILSYMSSPTMSWDELIAFWQSSAGPNE